MSNPEFEVPLSGPSVMALAAERAGVDLRAPLAPVEAVVAELEAREAQKIGRHACYAVSCETTVEPQFPFCKRHWYELPVAGRKRILANYTRGQCEDVSKIKPEWKEAVWAAVEFLLQGDMRHLCGRVFGNLPEGYDAAKLTVKRYGMATMVITQPDKLPLIASLATGEVRELEPAPPAPANDGGDPGDEQS